MTSNALLSRARRNADEVREVIRNHQIIHPTVELVEFFDLIVKHLEGESAPEPAAAPVAWRKPVDPQYDYTGRYSYRDDTAIGAPEGWEPLYAAPPGSSPPPVPEQPAPVRACRLVLDLQADTRNDLCNALENISCMIDRLEMTKGVSGGYNSGYTYEYTENAGPTHDEYAQQLKDYLAASRPTKGSAP